MRATSSCLHFPAKIVALCFCSYLVTPPNLANAHQFEDGYVERSVSVRVRDNVGEIEYAIGLNDATMKKFTHAWPQDQAILEQWKRERANPAASSTNLATIAPAEAPTIDAPEGELTNELEIIRAFAKPAATGLAQSLSVTCNGRPLELTLVSAEPSARHHATLIVTFGFRLPAQPQLPLRIEDTNFLSQPGGAKYSFKTLGKTMLLKSNVALIPVRADRIPLTGRSIEQRLSAGRIEAELRQFQAKPAGDESLRKASANGRTK